MEERTSTGTPAGATATVSDGADTQTRTQSPRTPQEGLLHSPGLTSAAMVWRVKSPATCADVCEAASRLMERLSELRAVHFVLGVSPHLAGVGEMALLPRTGPGGNFPSTQGALFIQFAAKTYADIAPALRLATSLLSPWCWLDEEVRGGRLADGREPFGFLDGLERPSKEEMCERITVPDGALAGSSWLLYLRFVQSIDRFSTLTEARREQVMGMGPDGQALGNPPDDSHVSISKSYRSKSSFVRRAFPWRGHGEEGLAFIAASADAEKFAQAMDRMLGVGTGPSDALLRYAWPVSGGIYLALPNAEALRELGEKHICDARTGTAPGGNFQRSDTSAATALRTLAESEKGEENMTYPDPIGPRVVAYNLSSGTYGYMMRMLDLGVLEGALGEMEMAPQVKELFEAMHHVVAGGDVKLEIVRRGNPDIVGELNRRLSEGMREANEINQRSGYYVTAAG